MTTGGADMAHEQDRDGLAEAPRCPGCGSVIDTTRHTCYPLTVDVTQPGYRYLEGIWGYCLTLSRDVRIGEDWLAEHDRRVGAEALREYAAELDWVRPEVSPCAPTFACCDNEASCDAMQRVTKVVGAAGLRARADRVEAAGAEGES